MAPAGGVVSAELRYAVAYAEHGWPVFPLWPLAGRSCTCPDAGCAAAGKHPITRGWPNAVASVPAAETAWAERLGRRGIGLPCGPRSGMWVLDVDPRHGGARALAGLECDYGPLPRSLRTRTGGDGLHVLFAWPDDGQPLSNANGLPPGLDTRGEGGYIVLPPSMHASGQRYRWEVPPRDGQLESAPDWLLELVRQRQRSLTPADAGATGDVKVPVGERHEKLVQFLGAVRSMGFGEEALVGFTRVYLETSVELDEARRPLDRKHAEQTARDIARRYPGRLNRCT